MRYLDGVKCLAVFLLLLALAEILFGANEITQPVTANAQFNNHMSLPFATVVTKNYTPDTPSLRYSSSLR